MVYGAGLRPKRESYLAHVGACKIRGQTRRSPISFRGIPWFVKNDIKDFLKKKSLSEQTKYCGKILAKLPA